MTLSMLLVLINTVEIHV